MRVPAFYRLLKIIYVSPFAQAFVHPNESHMALSFVVVLQAVLVDVVLVVVV